MKWSKLTKKLGYFARCQSGNFALGFAILAPLLLGTAGGVMDFMEFERQRSQMQSAADSVALAAAKEAAVHDWSPSAVQSVAESYVAANLEATSAQKTTVYKVVASPDRSKRAISVDIAVDHYNYFVLGYFTKSPQIEVHATAQLSGETATCLLGLDPSTPATLHIKDFSSINAKGCATYSNSIDPAGLSVDAGASIMSAFTCSSGGVDGKLNSFSPPPTKDCPRIDDPLSSRIEPVVGPCDETSLSIKNEIKTLNEGVYCDGLLIDNQSNVTLNPGVYIINGGSLEIRNSGSLKGKGVTLFFTGKDGRLLLDGTSTVNLSAPDKGSTAGLLMMQDRSMDLTDFEITSKSAAELLGTIYLPNGRLVINANNKIAEASAFTVVVARFISISNKTQMFLNSDYSSTTVPVPDGLGPNATPRLLN